MPDNSSSITVKDCLCESSSNSVRLPSDSSKGFNRVMRIPWAWEQVLDDLPNSHSVGSPSSVRTNEDRHRLVRNPLLGENLELEHFPLSSHDLNAKKTISGRCSTPEDSVER